jgi:hypothetical protein
MGSALSIYFGEVVVLGFGFVDVDNRQQGMQLAREIAAGNRRVADQMRRIDAPEDVAEPHREVIAILERLADEWVKSAARDDVPGGPNTDLLAGSELERLNTGLNEPLSEIQAQGYDIGWK